MSTTTSPARTPFFAPGAEEHFTDPEASVHVLLDLFPAEVTFSSPVSSFTLPKCRTLVSPTEVYVFSDGPRGPVLVFYDTITEPPAKTPTKGYALTPASPTIHSLTAIGVEPTNRCGCGSRLRGYRPFGRISYIPSR